MLQWLQRVAKEHKVGFVSYGTQLRTLTECCSSYMGKLKTPRLLCWLQMCAKDH